MCYNFRACCGISSFWNAYYYVLKLCIGTYVAADYYAITWDEDNYLILTATLYIAIFWVSCMFAWKERKIMALCMSSQRHIGKITDV